MRFTWDVTKNNLNVRRRGLATAEREDDRYDYGEVRMYAIGLLNGVETTVIYTERRNDERHIISAWQSSPNERRIFWEEIEGQAG
jgi:uncharacterized DUF497 family protein